jgi:endoglucanase
MSTINQSLGTMLITVVLWSSLSAPSFAGVPPIATRCKWPEWEQFKHNYIDDGRVIDRSDVRNITTSEGQSYALFFALVANDHSTFDQLLNWTQQHLAQGDLTSNLPAWLWGTDRKSETEMVLDGNSAADSDLWIAYTLAEAGRVWKNYAYGSIGYWLASHILDKETVTIPSIGTVLLPAPHGFKLKNNRYRVNPSYAPLQIMQKMDELYDDPRWTSLYQTSFRLIEETSPHGFSPDWAEWQGTRFTAASDELQLGSYNAIRSYLWAGMVSPSVAIQPRLINLFKPMVSAVASNGFPPRLVNTQSGQFQEQGSVGFSAALLPLIKSSGEEDLFQRQLNRVRQEHSFKSGNSYYDSVLVLFGLGWSEGRYQFGERGELKLKWEQQCQ